MSAEIITTDDLHLFKIELLDEFKKIIEESSGLKKKKWLKMRDVQSLLGISYNTLNSYRISGKLPFTKLGGIIYFDYEDIVKMMEAERVNS